MIFEYNEKMKTCLLTKKTQILILFNYYNIFFIKRFINQAFYFQMVNNNTILVYFYVFISAEFEFEVKIDRFVQNFEINSENDSKNRIKIKRDKKNCCNSP